MWMVLMPRTGPVVPDDRASLRHAKTRVIDSP
jgi:hypothetical protein